MCSYVVLDAMPATAKCSGGRGDCVNDPLVVIVGHYARCGRQAQYQRQYCKRCAVKMVARRAMEVFELEPWVEKLLDLVVLRSSPAIAAAERNAKSTAADTEVGCSTR
jgi:hypothetical protein